MHAITACPVEPTKSVGLHLVSWPTNHLFSVCLFQNLDGVHGLIIKDEIKKRNSQLTLSVCNKIFVKK